MRLAVVTDEINADLAAALAVARELGIEEVELNRVWDVSVAELSPDYGEAVVCLVREFGLGVCAVSTPAFKSLRLDEEPDPFATPEFRRHLEWIRAGCGLAVRLGSPRVRIFSFRRSGMAGFGNPSPRLPRGGPLPDGVLRRIAAGLRQAGDVAAEAGVTLVVENVRSCWGNSCWNTARILEAADHPALRMVWDPANDYVSGGDPFPEGYLAARPWLAHAHVKNASLVDPASGLTRWERPGAGDLALGPMLARLRQDGYSGPLVLETHWRGAGMTPEESTRAAFADLVALLSAG